jgi:Flp pilus assembly pilin Flp
MRDALKSLVSYTRTETGASIVEYALIIVLIAVVAFVAVNNIGPPVSSAFSQTAEGFTP